MIDQTLINSFKRIFNIQKLLKTVKKIIEIVFKAVISIFVFNSLITLYYTRTIRLIFKPFIKDSGIVEKLVTTDH